MTTSDVWRAAERALEYYGIEYGYERSGDHLVMDTEKFRVGVEQDRICVTVKVAPVSEFGASLRDDLRKWWCYDTDSFRLLIDMLLACPDFWCDHGPWVNYDKGGRSRWVDGSGSEVSEPKRCLKDCKRWAVAGSDFCSVHGGKVARRRT